MPIRPDPISLVEACYRLDLSEEDWMLNVAEHINQFLRETCYGTVGYHVDLDERGITFSHPVQSGGGEEVLNRIRSLAALLERKRRGETGLLQALRARTYEHVVRTGLRTKADRMLLSEIERHGPKWMYTLGFPGLVDIHHNINLHIDGHGATMFVTGLSKRDSLTNSERLVFQMLSAHIKASHRLRRQLGPDWSGHPGAGGAIMDRSFRPVHAEGEATQPETLRELQNAARRVDSARSAKWGRDEAALEIWQGLVSGRWSLVDQVDVDGKRYLLAHRNPENVTDPRGLTSTESRVAGLAVRGYSNKLIGYHLGMTEGTAASHLHRVIRKLGLTSRIELVRLLGDHFSTESQTRFQKEAGRRSN